LRKYSQPITPIVSRPSSSAQLGRGWTRDCASCSFSASKRCTSRWVFDQRSASWHTPQEIAAACIDALLTYDAGERLRSIRNPTLLIAAADDLLVPWQLSALIAEEIAHACFVKLDHGGHRFPQTRVEAYNTLLLEFFRAYAERDVPGAG